MYITKFPFQLVFTDLMGPIAPEAMGGYHYASKFTDAATRWSELYLLKNKSDAVAWMSYSIRQLLFPTDRASSAFARTTEGGMPTRI